VPGRPGPAQFAALLQTRGSLATAYRPQQKRQRAHSRNRARSSMPAPETAKHGQTHARSRRPPVRPARFRPFSSNKPSLWRTKPRIANRGCFVHLHRVAFHSLSSTTPQLARVSPNHTYHRGGVSACILLPPPSRPVSTLHLLSRPPRRSRMRRRAPTPKP
jgi:hypothetical protein